MKTLKLIVEGQMLKLDPTCDLDDLVPGTENYVRLEFSFSSEWKTLQKVAGFYSMLGTEYEPKLLTDGYSCMVPAEALKKRAFKVKIGGVNNETKLITNKLVITQNGGNS